MGPDGARRIQRRDPCQGASLVDRPPGRHPRDPRRLDRPESPTPVPRFDPGADVQMPVAERIRTRSALVPAVVVMVALVSLAGFAVHGRLSGSDTDSVTDTRMTPFWLTVTQGDGERARVALTDAGDATFQGMVPLDPPRRALPVARLSWSDPWRPDREVTVADVRVRLDRLIHRRAPMELAFGWLTLDEERGVVASIPRLGVGPAAGGGRWYYVLRLDRASGPGRALRVVVKRAAESARTAAEGAFVTR